MKDISSSTAALYDGGWRAEDKDQLVEEYQMTEDEAEEVCKELEKYEKKGNTNE